MPSILEAQIDFLVEQVHALSAGAWDAEQIDEAVAVSLSLYEGIVAAAASTAARKAAVESMLTHWLRSAEAILPAIREFKQRAGSLPRADAFVRAILKARAVSGARGLAGPAESRMLLDEVEHKLQRRTD